MARRFVLAAHLMGVTPNILTMVGLLVTAIGAALVAGGYVIAGGCVIVAAALFDILDGAVARASGKVQRYGAFLDSTSDRYAEAFTFMGLLYYFTVRHGGGDTSNVGPMLIIAALAGSLLVSYVRARAQALGFACEGGLLARPERVVITAIGLIVPPLLIPALWVLALLTNITALQRIFQVWRQARHQLSAES